MKDIIEQVLREENYSNNPYFIALKQGEFTKDDFVETQIQFYFAVLFFPRPMAAVAAKIPTHKQRLEVLRNVWEEHGEGEESDFHGSSFLQFLDRLAGVTEHDISLRELWPEVRAFNTILSGASVLDEFIVGVGVMGIIERMFSEISSWLGQGVVENGWLISDNMIHYNLHEELDIKHSQDFFDVLEPEWNKGVENQYLIEQGLRLGAYAFNHLYQGLYSARQRRRLASAPITRHHRT